MGVYYNANGNPNIYKHGVNVSTPSVTQYSGEAGQRNNLRGPGYFERDVSLGKAWNVAAGQELYFSWYTFNVTSSVRMDEGSLSNYLYYAQSLGLLLQ
jgi:hypothetical protein